MSNTLRYLLLSCFLLSFNISQGQNKLNLCTLGELAFQDGEKLTYVLYYNWNFIWIAAGTMEFEVKEGEEHYEIFVTGKTYPSYEWFFEVDDNYYARLRKNDLLPEYFSRDIKEGDYRILNDINFDRQNNKIRSKVKHNDQEYKHYTFGLNSCIHDLISLIYNLRSIDLEEFKEKKVIEAELIFDEKIYYIPIKYLGQQKDVAIRKIGKKDIHIISPNLIAGNVFNSDSNMTVWVSDDGNKIPLMIKSPIKVGSIKAVLKSHENLKEAFDIKK